MLIVCTKDQTIVDWTKSSESGAKAWGELVILDSGLTQLDATIQLVDVLKRLTDPLCLSAHGNDTEIGDEGSGGKYWTWTYKQLASHFLQAPGSYRGPVLIHACAKSISNFSTYLVLALQEIKELDGAWIYGYNTPIGSEQRYPEPNKLSIQADVQGALVNVP